MERTVLDEGAAKKSMSGSGAREHKDQLHKLQEKVGLVALLFLRTFYHY